MFSEVQGLDIAVIGCGSAGPAAALLLHRAGHRVRLFERVPELLPVGAGFMLQPTGLQVLQELGLLSEVLRHGAVVPQLYCRTTKGRRLLQLDYAEVDPRSFGLGMHRATFLSLLVSALEEAGIEPELGCAVDAIEVDSDERATLAIGERREGPFDLVVACDGARSLLRESHGPKHRANAYPWGAFWYICADPAKSFDGRLFQIVEGAGRMLGVLPTGRTTGDPTPLVSVFWSVPLKQAEEIKAAGIDAYKDSLLKMCSEVEPLVAQLESFEQLSLARYMDVRMQPWHQGPVVFIGDSAHATSPQLGQGVNLALIDALALSECVSANSNVHSALRGYHQARRRHLSYYQYTTRWLTPFFQSHSRTLGWVRDLAFPVAGLLSPIRKQMVKTMCGVKRGFLRSSLPMPQLALPQPEGEALSERQNELLSGQNSEPRQALEGSAKALEASDS